MVICSILSGLNYLMIRMGIGPAFIEQVVYLMLIVALGLLV
jgi:hypothetical protein